jgi:hypothetical protein
MRECAIAVADIPGNGMLDSRTRTEVILGRFTTQTHAMAHYVSADTPPLLTPRSGTSTQRIAGHN